VPLEPKPPESIEAIQRAYWETDQSERRAANHPAVVALFGPRAAFLAGLVPDASRASILDVGSGNGFLAAPLQSLFKTTIALDLSGAMLQHNQCERRIQASAAHLPFRDGSFDVVVCSHLLHHLTPADRRHAVREMTRVSRSAVVLYEPNRNNPAMFIFGVAKPEERMSLAFSRRYVRQLLIEAGLVGCDARVEGTVLPNKTPVLLVPLASGFERTPMRAWGFYVRAVGWKR
jgi:SAM-dependent methyltransferase